MKVQVQRPAAVVTAWAVLLFCMPTGVAAQERIFPSEGFHKELQKASQARQSNLEAIDRILASDVAQDLLKQARLDPVQVRHAVAQLSDAELERIAHQARAAEDDVTGGLIVGLLALIGLIVVIIFVVRAVR